MPHTPESIVGVSYDNIYEKNIQSCTLLELEKSQKYFNKQRFGHSNGREKRRSGFERYLKKKWYN